MSCTDIIFDLGGVLLDLKIQEVPQACMRLGIAPELFFVKADDENTSTVCQGISASKAITSYQVGKISSDDFLSLVLSHCSKDVTRDDVVEAWNACIGTVPKWRLDLLKELRQKGFGIHLLSNTNDLHWEEIKRRYFAEPGYTCPDLFDNVFVSHEMQLAKPDPAIYRKAVSVIGRPARQCLFIDDTQLNVDAALREGLNAAWLDIENPNALTEILQRFLE